MDAKKGDQVKIHYTLLQGNGMVCHSSYRHDPLQFTLGAQDTLPGFEHIIEGMHPGELKTEKIPAVLAYGARREDWVHEIPRKDLPGDLNLQVGQELEIVPEKGPEVPVVVAGLTENTVILDANHPLAGQDLVYQVQLLEIT